MSREEDCTTIKMFSNWLIDIKLLERLGTCRTDKRDKDDDKGIEPAPRTGIERPLATLTVFLRVAYKA